MMKPSRLHDAWANVLLDHTQEIIAAVPAEIQEPSALDFAGSAAIGGWLMGIRLALLDPVVARSLLRELDGIAPSSSRQASVERRDLARLIVAGRGGAS